MATGIELHKLIVLSERLVYLPDELGVVLSIDPADISYFRNIDGVLVVYLTDDTQIVVENFFVEGQAVGRLILSNEGVLFDVALDGIGPSGLLSGSYVPIPTDITSPPGSQDVVSQAVNNLGAAELVEGPTLAPINQADNETEAMGVAGIGSSSGVGLSSAAWAAIAGGAAVIGAAVTSTSSVSREEPEELQPTLLRPTIMINTPVGEDGYISNSEALALTISGTTAAVEAGQEVTVTYSDGTLSVSATALVSSDGRWRTDEADVSELAAGQIEITATVTNSQNISAQDESVTAFRELDPVITLTSISGISTTDRILDDNEAGNVRVSGTTANVEQGQVVSVTIIDDMNTMINIEAEVDADGSWVTNPTDFSELNQGQITVTAISSNLRGVDTPLRMEIVERQIGSFQLSLADPDLIGFRTTNVALADFDGDGDVDIIGRFFSAQLDLAVYANNGDGTFRQGQRIDLGELFGPETGVDDGLFAIDMNADGNLDLVLTREFSGNNSVRIFWNDGNGGFADSIELLDARDGRVTNLEIADVGGDGRLDIVTHNGTTGTVVFVSNPDGTFQRQVIGEGSFGIVREIEVGDLNGDGLADIALIGASAVIFPNEIPIFFGQTGGGFVNTPVRELLNFQGTTVLASSPEAKLIDLNDDGTLDLVVETATSAPSGATSHGIHTFLRTNDAGFEAPTQVESDWTDAGVTELIVTDADGQVLDFNTDGNADIAVLVLDPLGMSEENALVLFLGDGNGGFDQGTRVEGSFKQGSSNTKLAVADLDQDGRVDLVATGNEAFLTVVWDDHIPVLV